MDVGDQVLYIANGEIDLDRDLGKIVDWANEDLGLFTVEFSDGFKGPIDKDDLMRVITPHEKRMSHGYFGCLEDPCPFHSTKKSEGDSA